MIYGAINEKEKGFCTYLKKLFDSIDNSQRKYNWLITNFEGYPQQSEVEILFNNEYIWLSGERLTEIVDAEDFQWIWGVLSGFPKYISLEDVLKYPLPYADGYTGFWKNPITLQHPLSDVEIVPWDSTLTLLLGKDKELIEKFMKAYPYSENLEDYNNI